MSTAQATGRTSRPDAMTGPKARRFGSTLLPTAFMVVTLVYSLVPLLWLVISSTKSNSGLFDSFGFWFGDEVRLGQNLSDLFAYQDGVFGRWMVNTLLYSVVSAGGAAVFAALGGYAFAKYSFRGKNALYALILGSIMVPTTALAIPTYLMFSETGIVDTPVAIILPSLLSPFGIFLMKVYAEDAVPDSVIESARIDGAGEWRIFWSIGFRLLAPAFVTVLLFALVTTWNNYFLPLVMLNTPDYYPVTVGLALLNSTANAGGGAQPLLNLVVTGSLVSIIPPVVAFVLLQRYWQTGLSAGGVKG